MSLIEVGILASAVFTMLGFASLAVTVARHVRRRPRTHTEPRRIVPSYGAGYGLLAWDFEKELDATETQGAK